MSEHIKTDWFGTPDERLWFNEPIPDGPWLDEPHHLFFTDRETGYECRLRRNPSYAWCGYVEVPNNHPLFKQPWNKLNYHLDCHGGVTFWGYPSNTLSLAFGDENTWWVGFDCSHGGDLSPISTLSIKLSDQIYRNLEYAQSQVKRLCTRLKELENKPLPPMPSDDDDEDEE